MNEPLTIGEVARRAGVGVETVRFYERRGLIAESRRKPSGYRQFDEQAVRRILFIRRAKELGFTLEEIKDLLAISADPDTTCADVKERTETKLADIESRIQSLGRMKRALTGLLGACDGRGSLDECPILEALARDDAFK